MRHFLSLKFDYFTNFPVKSNWMSLTRQEIKTSNKNSRKRMCKNIILFILFLKFLKKIVFKIVNLKIKLGILIQPRRQNIFNYLRAPYKNKLARNQIYNPRFKLSLNLNFYKFDLYEHEQPGVSFELINFLKKNLSGFESNILYLNKICIFYKAFFKTY